jgi:hypothetical protein
MLKSRLTRTALAGASAVAMVATAHVLATEPTAFFEDFATDPATRGWKTSGAPALFQWNVSNQNLEVTWDSAQPNSFFCRPLGVELNRGCDFTFAFDLRLSDITAGTTPGKPYTFELAIGLVNLAQASQAGFLRGTGLDSPNLVEFDYFPDSGYGATICPTIISSNMQFATGFNIVELTPDDTFRVTMRYDSDVEELTTGMTRNGQPFTTIEKVTLKPEFTDFLVDHLAVCSYSDAGQDPQWSGSILAHGVVDNVFLLLGRTGTLEMGLRGRIVDGHWQAEFDALPSWSYALYRTADFESWSLVATASSATRQRLVLADPGPPTAQAQFYRLFASWP